MLTKLIKVILTSCFPLTAFGATHNVPLPYSIDGLASLVELAKNEPGGTSQVINLDEGNAIVGVFRKVGSGITTTDAYVYTCSPNGRCTLYTFIRSRKKNLKLDFDDNATELVVRSEGGMVVLRVPSPLP